MRDAGVNVADISSLHQGRRDAKRIRMLRLAVQMLAALLLLKITISIILQYGLYFPPDFEQGFLLGRKSYFFGLYGIAFYIHIISGPISLMLGALLISRQWSKGSATSNWLDQRHRLLGRVQFFVVIFGVLPAGLIMATKSFGGFVAGLGLTSLGIMTGCSMLLAVYHAKTKNIKLHQRWATRCFILLCSPLLLRIATGLNNIFGLESVLSHQIVAWASWIVPLGIYECARTRTSVARWLTISQSARTDSKQINSQRGMQ